VERRLMVRSNPPGATVYVDGYEIGTTPIATDFIYYGTRQIRLVKDGYETLTVDQPIATPWWEFPPLDFVSENVVPGNLRDVRTLTYQLTPQLVVPAEQIRARAEQLRQSAPRPGSLPPVYGTAPPAGNPGAMSMAPAQGVPPPQMQPLAPAGLPPGFPAGAPGGYPPPGPITPQGMPDGIGGQPVRPLP
jgi:hypothetical protein